MSNRPAQAVSVTGKPGVADSRRVLVAPMMEWTDRHCRYFLRLLAPDVGLYTEMITAHAVVHGDRDRLLGFHPAERPLALQLGGSEPALLGRAVALAAPYGYDEINLNVGCPSPRVASGAFGACLFREPALVADCVAAMAAATDVPVTVKTRIGVDDVEDYESLAAFVECVAAAGCGTFIVHARKAYLQGLSPRENRDVPPLRYEVVYRLKADFPALTIVINGGITTLEQVRTHLARVDGVMLGRQAYAEPRLLSRLQAEGLAGPGGRPGWRPPSQRAVLAAMADYADRAVADGARLHHVSRHLLGLAHGQQGARRWRRFLSTGAVDSKATGQLIRDSIPLLDREAVLPG